MRFKDVQWDSDEERGLFVEEAIELLSTLEEGALQSPPPMDAMFRAAHTLKGSGGMLGLTEWVERAHRLEDAMDRRGKPDWQWTPDIMQLCLDTVDALRDELGGSVPASQAPSVEWELTWDPQCAMPGVRAYQALMAVREAFPNTRSDPPEEELAVWTGQTSGLWVPGDADEQALRELLGTVDELAHAGPRLNREPAEREPDPQEPAKSPASAERRDAIIRISADTLESILEGLGELLLDHGQLEHHWRNALDPTTRGVLDHLRRRALDLQDLTLRARMLPLDTLFRQYPRAVHDIARKLNKKIQLETAGGETELDRVVMDRLHEPILHLLRNSCDHGIESPKDRRQHGKPETGTIRLAAYAAQGHVHLQIEDDGGGIDWQRLREKAVRQGWMNSKEAARASEEQLSELLFRPGVSTAEHITDISGRGVGLDVVHAFLEEIHGAITVESQPGAGTTFHIELPMTMAIMTALIVEAGPWSVGFPIAAVERIEVVAQSGLGTALGRAVVPDHAAPMPVYSLVELLDPEPRDPGRYIVRVKDGRTQAALVVDGVRGQQEVVIKPVVGLMGLTPWLSGVALLGDGRLALMVDVRRLVPVSGNEVPAVAEDHVLRAGSNQMEVLVFRLSDGQPYGINVFKTREVLARADVTRVPGQHPWLDGFLHIRGQTIPVMSLHRALALGEPPDAPPVFLVTEFNQTVQAFPVDQIERMIRVGWDEVHTLPAILDQASASRFTGIIDHPDIGPIQLIDFEHLIAQIAPVEEAPGPWQESLREVEVWIADDSRIARRQIIQALEPMGLNITSFTNGEELWSAVQRAESLPALFVVDVEMPRMDGYTLTANLKGFESSRDIPVLLHTSLSGHWHTDRASMVRADGVVTKFEPGGLQEAVAKLLSSPVMSSED